MSKKLFYFISFVLVVVLNSNALAGLIDDPSLVIYFSFDSVSDIVIDQSGNGHDGVIVGDVTAEPVGKHNGAAKFDGIGGPANRSYIDMDGPNFPAEEVPTSAMTLMAWAKCQNTGDHQTFFNARASDGTWLIHPEARSNGEFRWLLRSAGGTTIFDIRAGVVTWDEWLHFAGTYDKASGKATLYINGEMVREENVSSPADIAGDWGQGARVGYDIDDARAFTGLMDDFLMFRRALSLAEVNKLMQGIGSPLAFGPTPADGSLHEDTWANVNWFAGDSAASHDVYFSDDYDAVNEGSAEAFQGNQTSTFIVVGFPGFAFPDGLVPGTTYYWRIDEVNDTEPNSPWIGPVWSFMLPPKTAYYPIPSDATESVALDAVLSWTAGFGAKLHTVYIGDTFDDVSNASGGATQGGTTYTPSTLEPEKIYYWRVDEFDAVDTYKGDVWSFSTPGAVGNLNPANGATDVKQALVLEWVAADNAASHEVYLGTDKDAVRNADKSSSEYKGSMNLGSESYDAGDLLWDTLYYWRVDAVKADGTTQKGLIWSFTTANFLIVDDFESYNDDFDEETYTGTTIWNTWIDGLFVWTSGSMVGYEYEPFAETQIVHGGLQAMPFFYDNDGTLFEGDEEGEVTGVPYYSETQRMWAEPQDWTRKGVEVLSLWFYGEPDNSADPFYVGLEDSAGNRKDITHPDSTALTVNDWQQWHIPLADFTDVDPTAIKIMYIGVGDPTSNQSGGSGLLRIDDIELHLPTEQ